MRQYRNVGEALGALASGYLADEAENNLPPAVVRALIRHAEKRDTKWGERKLYIRYAVRYEGSREILWFWAP